jgi:dTDP-4-dehydrorhamnose 3,5-epimerase
MAFHFKQLGIPGLILLESTLHLDERGLFMEEYKKSDFVANGIPQEFVQDNLSLSQKGVLRGLHFQYPPSSQGKLVRVIKGSVWDVAADIRPGSKTYGKWVGVTLDDTARAILYVPSGFAHGFIALADDTILAYKCTAEYDQSRDAGVRWNDEELAISWPGAAPIVSAKDQALPRLRDLGRAE